MKTLSFVWKELISYYSEPIIFGWQPLDLGIVVIPLSCWIVALFAGWLCFLARGKPRPLSAE